jgi:5-formyltetrahydrofolate cyclo-ligase
LQEKSDLRGEMRAKRKEFVGTIPGGVRSLILNRPPALIADALRECRTVGLYSAVGDEAPTAGWARWLHENGWQIALPRFAGKSAAMEFRRWLDPWDEDELEPGLLAIPQPRISAETAAPDALIVPLVAFTADCHRLGQGGGHYDRWLGAHPPRLAIGLAWDVQRVEWLPIELHDRQLDAVVTPTRIHWKDA